MKRVTWKLMKRIEDPETKSSVSLEGVTITGTPLQVAVLFECLFNLPGKVDLFVPDQDAMDIKNMGVEALKNARDSKEWVEWYEDPDLPEDEEDISKWLNLVSKWKVEIIE
jgi:hypothetical protein